jgi:hypothetical protein
MAIDLWLRHPPPRGDGLIATGHNIKLLGLNELWTIVRSYLVLFAFER